MRLQGTRVQFPATWCFTSIFSRRSHTIFWPPKAPGMHGMYRHTRRRNSHAYKIKIEILKKKKDEISHTTV